QKLGFALQLLYRLIKVDDVDLVFLLENVGPHFRVPALGLVPKMHAGLQKFRHKFTRICHREINAPADGRADVEDAVRLPRRQIDRKSTRLNSSHVSISYAVFCLKKKK